MFRLALQSFIDMFLKFDPHPTRDSQIIGTDRDRGANRLNSLNNVELTNISQNYINYLNTKHLNINTRWLFNVG